MIAGEKYRCRIPEAIVFHDAPYLTYRAIQQRQAVDVSRDRRIAQRESPGLPIVRVRPVRDRQVYQGEAEIAVAQQPVRLAHHRPINARLLFDSEGAAERREQIGLKEAARLIQQDPPEAISHAVML